MALFGALKFTPAAPLAAPLVSPLAAPLVSLPGAAHAVRLPLARLAPLHAQRLRLIAVGVAEWQAAVTAKCALRDLHPRRRLAALVFAVIYQRHHAARHRWIES